MFYYVFQFIFICDSPLQQIKISKDTSGTDRIRPQSFAQTSKKKMDKIS